MFRSVLVANRGEIARRVLRTARAIGLKTVAVFSDADRDAPFLALADQALPIGPAHPRESYLRIDAVLNAARRSGAEAIHPGYGFLSENADFAQACADAGITFVGPPASAIRRLGSKIDARRLADENGIPTVPGISRPVTAEDVRAFADRHGLPVLLKAAAGGGGRGMRVIRDAKDLDRSVRAASREAEGSFGSGDLFVERYFPDARHIEVQVLADTHGHVVHLHERECSIQRRHQKLLEESPSPGLADSTRAAMTAAAVRLVKAAGYVNAGTVEFLVNGDGLHFLEVNTRLQVEHPVTELRTGRDLVADQFRIAAGEPLGFTQDDVRPQGHAVEVRVCAEDPFQRFLPASGTIRELAWPPGVRVDTDLEAGAEVLPFYDSMIAKVIAHGPTRDAALDRLSDALAQTRIIGVPTTIPFHRRLLQDPDFRAGRTNTRFIPDHLALVTHLEADLVRAAAAAAALERQRIGRVSWGLAGARRVGAWREEDGE